MERRCGVGRTGLFTAVVSTMPNTRSRPSQGVHVELPNSVVTGERARLMPVVADTSKEVRATSVLLATMEGVPAFAKALLSSVGQSFGSRSRLTGFCEVVFREAKDSQLKGRPDGMLIHERGGRTLWSALVESKVGRSQIVEEQLVRYVALAKSQGINAVVTISNEFVALPSHHPVRVPKTLLRNVDAFHWSWMHVLTEALLLLNSDDFENPSQRFILQEMVRYFSHPSIGISTHDRMNSEWRELVTSVQAGMTLSKTSDVVRNSVGAWHQESRDLALLMTRKLGRSVDLRLTRSHQKDAATRLKDDIGSLVKSHKLTCAFAVPDAASPVDLVCDIDRRSVTVSMNIQAPSDRQRASSRLNWLLRQIAKADSSDIHVRMNWPGRAPPTQSTLENARADASCLIPEGPMLPASFDLMLIRDLAGKFAGSKTFLEEVEAALPYFYEQVGQYLREYVPNPPRVISEKHIAKQDPKNRSLAAEADHSEKLLETASLTDEPLIAELGETARQ